MENRIIVISPFYNPGEFLDNCINSLLTQKYDNYHIYFVDDASNDGSYDKLPIGHPKVTVISNCERRTALENLHYVITNFCKSDDIVVIVDGDDWLPNKKVLSYINDYYINNDCWIMYGQASWTDGNKGCAIAYPNKEYFDNIRNSPVTSNGQPTGFFISHIRTFRAGLYNKIKEQDENFDCLKDKDGNFYRMTYDVAMMLPMMEMAGFEKTKYNDTVLYTYNRGNPILDDRVNQQLQWDIHKEIYQKPKFNKIESF